MPNTKPIDVDAGRPGPSVPDLLLPQQFSDLSARCTSDAPERRLVLAVLLNAILQLRSRDPRDVAEAEDWILDSEISDSPFSFANICDMIGIEANHFVRGLLEWRDGPTDTAAPPRRHVRTSRAPIRPLHQRSTGQAIRSRPC